MSEKETISETIFETIQPLTETEKSIAYSAEKEYRHAVLNKLEDLYKEKRKTENDEIDYLLNLPRADNWTDEELEGYLWFGRELVRIDRDIAKYRMEIYGFIDDVDIDADYTDRFYGSYSKEHSNYSGEHYNFGSGFDFDATGFRYG